MGSSARRPISAFITSVDGDDASAAIVPTRPGSHPQPRAPGRARFIGAAAVTVPQASWAWAVPWLAPGEPSHLTTAVIITVLATTVLASPSPCERSWGRTGPPTMLPHCCGRARPLVDQPPQAWLFCWLAPAGGVRAPSVASDEQSDGRRFRAPAPPRAARSLICVYSSKDPKNT
eukprot:scaffold395_cov383-Prasinococcus_capsulatus_cf.AAC.4